MKFEKIKYPDGQISVKLLPKDITHSFTHRISTYEDLMVLLAVADVLKLNGMKNEVTLTIPCLFGQRSDRRFDQDVQSFDLKIICDLINSCEFRQVQILDPHSDVCMALIDNSKKISSYDYVYQTMLQTYTDEAFCLVSPDAGAYKKVFEYGAKMNREVVAANKHRTADGTIALTFLGDVKGKKCLIVDDICDGGATFVALGKELKAQGADEVFLYVSHGYFSKGFKELNEVIDGTWCTDSVQPIGDYFQNGPGGKLEKTNVKQFKIK